MDHAERLSNLESTVAFQDRTIEELNQVVTSQEERIVALEAKFEVLLQSLQTDETGVGDPADEPPPPHY